MQLSLKGFSTIATMAAVAATSIVLSAGSASARPITFDGAYVGAGVAVGVTRSGLPGGEDTFGGNIQARVAIPGAPVSVRGAVLFGGENTAVMPIVSYDVPVSSNANVYVGAGYSFIDKAGVRSPLGNQDSFVATVGAEGAINRNIVVYGDVKWAPDGFQNSSADAVSIQGGVGYRF
jgi:hypothetical protein